MVAGNGTVLDVCDSSCERRVVIVVLVFGDGTLRRSRGLGRER